MPVPIPLVGLASLRSPEVHDEWAPRAAGRGAGAAFCAAAPHGTGGACDGAERDPTMILILVWARAYPMNYDEISDLLHVSRGCHACVAAAARFVLRSETADRDARAALHMVDV